MFVTGKDPSLDPASSSYTAKFYGVRSGRIPGVYTDWASAEAQVKGVAKPKVKWFPTREEAETFVRCGATVAKEIEAAPPRRQQPTVSAPPPPPPLSTEAELSDSDLLELLSSRSASVVLDPVDTPSASKKRKPTISTIAGTVAEGNLLEREINEAPAFAERTLQKGSQRSPVLKIYTDGSALSNGQSGAKAGVGVWFGERDARYSTPLSFTPMYLTPTFPP
ncbi:hypothetical protein FN846DRAFT_395735 [Sphaerosporella brunnea]|uniref:Ribonuclease H1 N-terminal domain-containing protein n=1 Tax=Sphaerosporella brunnea TaxID=1250544 RepID=A0A5J5F5F2_9PEZI|nr:hypothetical protein FN846DRAFT_395735 [Sphaerosporella brunnea]